VAGLGDDDRIAAAFGWPRSWRQRRIGRGNVSHQCRSAHNPTLAGLRRRGPSRTAHRMTLVPTPASAIVGVSRGHRLRRMERALKRGRHVHIRRLRLDDGVEFLQRARDSSKLHRPWSYPPLTPREFRRIFDGDPLERSERIVVCRNDDRAIVGYFALVEIVRGSFQSAYLGYYAFEPFAGRGYMREGLDLVLRYAFDDLRLHRVEANIQPGNGRSVALVRGAGFRKEGLARRYLKVGGRWRDHEHWALTVEERRARRPA
jgi:[ribosomal protein S5]-alanine N-acetyltransferase